MQSERAPKGVRPTSFVRVARAAAAQRGLLSGMRATVAKHSCHSCVYFATFAEMQAHLQAPPRAAAAHTGAAHSAAAHAPGGSGQAGQGRRVGSSLGAGFVAGVAAGTVNNPFDVLKSRQQVALALTLAPTLALTLALTRTHLPTRTLSLPGGGGSGPPRPHPGRGGCGGARPPSGRVARCRIAVRARDPRAGRGRRRALLRLEGQGGAPRPRQRYHPHHAQPAHGGAR